MPAFWDMALTTSTEILLVGVICSLAFVGGLILGLLWKL